MTRIFTNLYAICSLDPVTTVPDSMQMFTCLPLDVDGTGVPSDMTRYITLVMIPDQVKAFEILPYFQGSRAFAAKWITYMWEVS